MLFLLLNIPVCSNFYLLLPDKDYFHNLTDVNPRFFRADAGEDSPGEKVIIEASPGKCASTLASEGDIDNNIRADLDPETCSSVAHALHELMHVHEHQRGDRDDYVIVHTENTKDERQIDFVKYFHLAPVRMTSLIP